MVSLNVSGVIRDGIRDSKVDQLKLATYKNKICRFEIRVDNLFLVNDMYRLQHLHRINVNL
jgi:hypothetical protein